MSLAAEPIPSPADPRPHRWTRSEYYRMADFGLLDPNARVELIEGEIVEKMSPQRTTHTAALQATAEALENAFGDGFCVRCQFPLTLDDHTEPEPDILVVRGAYRDYRDHHPGSGDVLMVAEISDTTLAYDRTKKAALYASAGIAEYWVVNVPQRQVEVYSHPDPALGYQSTRIYTGSDVVTPATASQLSVTIAEIFE